MTKAKMIEMLQEKEAELWLDLAEYDYYNAPRTGSHADEMHFDLNDYEHGVRLHAWNTVNEILETFGIASNHSEEAYEFHHKLFIEREAARGIFYTDSGEKIQK